MNLKQIIFMGNPQRLANATNIKIVSNIRENDVSNGGQGAPLVPIFHYALAKKHDFIVEPFS